MATPPSFPRHSSDLPFLVTHWLAHYGQSEITQAEQLVVDQDEVRRREDAIDRIRLATQEIASSFAVLGAFGPSINIPFNSRRVSFCDNRNNTVRNALYDDVRRRWPTVLPSHLNALLRSAASTTNATQRAAMTRALPQSITDAASEASRPSVRSHTGNLSEDRRVIEQTQMYDSAGDVEFLTSSLLERPTLLSSLDENLQLVNSGCSQTTSALMGATALVDREISMAVVGDLGPNITPRQRQIMLSIGSDHDRVNILAAHSSRRLIDLRAKFCDEQHEISSHYRSLNIQKGNLEYAQKQKGEIVVAQSASFTNDSPNVSTNPSNTSALDSIEGNAERVIAQLSLKMKELHESHTATEKEIRLASSVAHALWNEASITRRQYCDPFRLIGGASANCRGPIDTTLPVPLPACGSRGTSLLSILTARQYGGAGGSWCQSRPVRRPAGTLPSLSSLSQIRKSILAKRLSYAATINCHLFYPIYCVCFDRTGRYVITGADDHISKLFHLGSSISTVSDNSNQWARCNYGANARGAVLVCTLRGHAGVITDVDVSADNAMLATASEDGDVRVWGLKDGSPVAILRGHEGGANMVSWSTLTPSRLVTTGQDGLARVWDVREAALKRYGAVIGSRSDYTVLSSWPQPNDSIPLEQSKKRDFEEENSEHDSDSVVMLPPLPVRQRSSNADNGLDPGEESGAGAIVPPALAASQGSESPAFPQVNIRPVQRDPQNLLPGSFVATNAIDEGVLLLEKLQHGELVQNEEIQSPGTRSRRKAVKVICVARCPVGGHFATGSDDGIGRIWADFDDNSIEVIDQFTTIKDSSFKSCSISPHDVLAGQKRSLNGMGRNTTPSKDSILASLTGHLNAITDIQYSNAGDRILTASQKDGVVRIWTWGTESAVANRGTRVSHETRAKLKFDQFKQIIIRLTASAQNKSENAQSRPAGRRRNGTSRPNCSSTQGSSISCDVATWTSDDSKVVTSQSCPLKSTGSAIEPGSQMLRIWDSRTGHCLLGIPSAHSASCPVLVSHPYDSSVLASAGLDGLLNVWDLDNGKAFLSHRNQLNHGPAEQPTDRGKDCGYLDGGFSPDGLFLVLSDDSGRITILDTLVSTVQAQEAKSIADRGTSMQPISLLAHHDTSSLFDDRCTPRYPPEWMKEQYFANDYYDLFYDTNGYCIEQGSQQPPHLAPRAARCFHTGSAHASLPNDAFSKMIGPAPLHTSVCMAERASVRVLGSTVRAIGGILFLNTVNKNAAIHAKSLTSDDLLPPSANFSVSSNLIGGAEIRSERPHGRSASQIQSSHQRRGLSSNYRWRDYEDVLREESLNEDENGDDDEEYEDPPVPSPGTHQADRDDLSEIADTDEDVDPSDHEPATRSSDRTSATRRGRGRRRLNRGTQDQRGRRAARGEPEQRSQRNASQEEMSALQETILSQPSRVSRRQMARRNRRNSEYEEALSSDDETYDEFLSTRTAEGSEYPQDYTVEGHFFKLPAEGIVRRKWLSRSESKLGFSGRKNYAPQVGDSVIYIPRSHYNTLKEFPSASNSGPWKLWPETSAWPVVRCIVRDIRYRFPYSAYYRGPKNDTIVSIVAILKLEVNGIPHLSSDGRFPWLRPNFITRQTRSCSVTFEVGIFESGHADFILPESLYIWRLRCLESTIRARNNDAIGLEAVAFWTPENIASQRNLEDPELQPHRCTIVEVRDAKESESHFINSGFEAIQVSWPDKTTSSMCTWELLVPNQMDNIPEPPTLDEIEKQGVNQILDDLEEDPLIKQWFSQPVDDNQYVDYFNMIEIPMDISFVRKRLENDYYTNGASVLADMKLIRENCYKYNGGEADIGKKSDELYKKFEAAFTALNRDISTGIRHRKRDNIRRTEVEDESQTGHSQDENVQMTRSRTRMRPHNEHTRALRGRAEILRIPNTRRGSRRTSRREDSLAATQGERGGVFISQERQRNAGGRTRATRKSARIQTSSLEVLPVAEPPNERTNVGGNHETQTTPSSARSEEESTSEGDAPSSEGDAPSSEGDAPSSEGYASESGDEQGGAPSSEGGAPSSEGDASESGNEQGDEETPSKSKNSAISDTCESSSPQSEPNPTPKLRPNKFPSGVKPTMRVTRSKSGSAPKQPSRISNACLYSSDDSDISENNEEGGEGAEVLSEEDEEEIQSDQESHEKGTPSEGSNEFKDDDDDDEVGSESPPRRLTRKRARQTRSSPRKSQPRSENTPRMLRIRRTRRTLSLKEDDAVSSDEFVELESKRGKKKTVKRTVHNRQPRRARKKRKTATDRAKSGNLYYPSLAQWPDNVPVHEIPAVAEKIMDRMDEEDYDRLFSKPVSEDYPDLADHYLKVIKVPMDFRTIRSDRVGDYEKISELQDDLQLVFRNCCVYNGEDSENHHYATAIWQNVNTIYKEICEKEEIELPSRGF